MELALHEAGALHLRGRPVADLDPQGLIDARRCLDDRELVEACRCGELFLHAADLFDGLVSLFHGTDHDLLGDPLGAALDHRDPLFGTGDHDVQLTVLALIVGRIDHERPVAVAQADGADRSRKGNVGNRHRRRGGDHRDHVRRIDLVRGDYGGDDLDLSPELLGKQRPQWTIDQPGDQDFPVFGPPLPLDETTGDLARRVVFLVVLHRQRQEIDPLALVF